MLNDKLYAALSACVYMNSMALAGKAIETDDQRIRVSALYPDWKSGNHIVGEIYNANGQTWECYQQYDNAVYPDIIPENSAWYTFNRPLHGKTKSTARPWVQPTHSLDIYFKGEYMVYTDGVIYCCVAEHGTAYSPEAYPVGWKEVTS